MSLPSGNPAYDIIYLEEIDYYLEREDDSPETYSLHVNNESNAPASLTVNADGTLTIDIPAYTYTRTDGKMVYTLPYMTLKAEKSNEPDVLYGYQDSVGKHYAVTDCPDPFTMDQVYTTDGGKKYYGSNTYSGFKIGKENPKDSSYILLYYDYKDPTKLSFVQIYLLYSKLLESGEDSRETGSGYTYIKLVP